MTRKTNARLAGFMFLFYIATGLANLALFNQVASGAEGTAAQLASIAQHATTVRLTRSSGIVPLCQPSVSRTQLFL